MLFFIAQSTKLISKNLDKVVLPTPELAEIQTFKPLLNPAMSLDNLGKGIGNTLAIPFLAFNLLVLANSIPVIMLY